MRVGESMQDRISSPVRRLVVELVAARTRRSVLSAIWAPIRWPLDFSARLRVRDHVYSRIMRRYRRRYRQIPRVE